jgi:hypothetical protein
MARTRWSDDAFLDEMRRHGDKHADECVAQLDPTQDFALLFRSASRNDAVLPAGAPVPLECFFADTGAIPPIERDRVRFPDGVDHARLRRGETVFMEHAFVACVVLLAKALPEGYSAPCLSRVLSLSGNLKRHPYRRLLGVLQLVVDVASVGGFERGGRAVAAAQQARLMHAGIRTVVPRYLPDYEARFGTPVNLEDMLGTIMGLSLLVIDGMPRLGVGLGTQDADDYYYLWRTFALAMGIHPPDEPTNDAWIPATIAEAREFYQSYERRHYATRPEDNPAGVELARINLQMLEDMLPRWLRSPTLRRVPQSLMARLIGREGCERVGLSPVRIAPPLRFVLLRGLQLVVAAWHRLDRLDPTGSMHATLSETLLQGMIVREYGGEVTFRIPRQLQDVRELVATPHAAGGTA